MRKYMKKIVMGLLIGSMLLGCGDSTNPKDDVSASVDGDEDKDENVDSTQEPTSELTQEPTQEPNQNVNNGESSDNNGLDIQLPSQGELIADYTSVEGLTLEAGSHIAVVVKSTQIEYWQAVKEGMQQAIDDLNESLGYTGNDKIYMTYEGPKVDNSVDQQVNILDAVVSENPDVICLAAIDMNSCMAQVESANQNGIPVIILDSGLSTEELIYSNCSTDNYSAGKEAARRLCESIGGEGQVAVLAHLQLSETSVNRLDGFLDEVAANYPNVEIVNVSYEQADDLSLLEEQMKAVLTLYPNLKGYFCTNQVVSEVALDVLEEDEYAEWELSLVGFDMGEEQLEAIRDGRQTGTVCQNPYGMGYATVVAGVRAAMGLENDKSIDAGFQWLDQTNIDLEENARYLYE